ncbi:thrombospondin type-1 domain-containing protein 1 [Pelodytes ibericus]
MRQTLRSLISVSLVLLWDCVLGEPGYLLLRKTHHVALSRDSVYVDFFLPENDTITSTNISIFLVNMGNNQKVAMKDLPANMSQGGLVFECFYFIEAGLYQFQMNLQTENSSRMHWRSSILNVTWPLFHIELNRTLKDMVRSFQIGVSTNERLCSVFPNKDHVILLEVEHTHSFQELEEPSSDRFMLYKTYKEIPLSSSQWVEFQCASVRPETFITVSLKPMVSDSVIAFLGPIDLVKTFKYKLVMATEQKCEASVNVHVIPPPCNYVEGKLVVYQENQRSFSESGPLLAEHIMHTGDKMAQFNCSLFDIGKNKYCFDFIMLPSSSHSFPRSKECVEIRREIETWSLWQSWSPCSTTCGDGVRERHRECLTISSDNPSCNGSPKETSLCSLDDCSSVKPSSKSTKNSKTDSKTSNTVTITGISLCLFIIIITIVITVWRKLSNTQKCHSTVRHSSSHSVNCRKNSDEENIFQVRESFFETGEVLLDSTEDGSHLPLNYRQSSHVPEEQGVTEKDTSQSNVQKILPPIFSYRLAQQQLKEMRQKGLTETTKVYHVSQNPMVDTAVDISLTPPQVTDNSEETIGNTFRIQSPFLEAKLSHGRSHGERPISKSAFPPLQGTCPSQTLPRLSHLKSQDAKPRHYERGYQKSNNFRRTSSFHETKHNRPYRERSLTTLSPRQSMSYNPKTRAWEYATVERLKNKSARTENIHDSTTRAIDSTVSPTKLLYKRPGESRPDLICNRHVTARASNAERPEQNRPRKGLSPVNKSWNRGQQDFSTSPKNSHNKSSSLTPAQYRREKCQSFPWGTEYAFYDNSTFGLTEAEQQMIDLPGYFASNEEDETSTLSVERLVI